MTQIQFRYSLIAKYLKEGANGILNFLKNENEELDSKNDSIRFGNLTELLLFFPSQFDKKYVIVRNKPTDSIKLVVDYMIKNNLEFTEDNIGNACANTGFKQNWYNNEHKSSEGYLYYCFLKENSNKIHITDDEYNIAKLCVKSIKNNKKVNKYINTLKNCEVYDQLTVISNIKLSDGTYKNFKSTFDRLIIDRKNKKIQIVDLKTGYKHPMLFKTVYLDNKYYIQSLVYQLMAKNLINNECYNENNEIINLNLDGYSLEPFRFLYICSKHYKMPIIAKVEEENLFPISEFEKLLNKIEWHIINKIYDVEYDYTMLDEINIEFNKE